MYRVVIVGGGFGGLAAAQALSHQPVVVTVVDRRNHHLFQPLLYQVATSVVGATDVAWPIRHILRDQANATVILATVVGIEAASRQVLLEDGSSLPYDSLIVATGSTHAYFGHDAWAEFAPGLKTLEDATRIRRRLLLAFEAAEREPDAAKRRSLLTFVVVGGGPTGCEMAGAIIELARSSLARDYRVIAPEDVRVVLVEAVDQVLSTFEPELSDYAYKALKKLGVEVQLNHPVTSIDGNGISLGEERIETKNMIWAAGVAASPVARWLGLEGDKAGRVKVDKDLSVPGFPGVFVVGDTAAMRRPDGKPVPGIAPAAKQAGRYAAEVIAARVRGGPVPEPFRYAHAGDLATIGKGKAVIDFGEIKLKGALAWWFWGTAHIFFLIGGRNRLAVAMSWLWIYLTGQRSARLITQGEAEAKAPLKEVTDPETMAKT